jgi:hypothetical protein
VSSEESALDKVQRAISDFETFRAADGILSIRQRAKRTLPATAQDALDALGYDELVKERDRWRDIAYGWEREYLRVRDLRPIGAGLADELQNLRTTLKQDLIYQARLEASIERVFNLARNLPREMRVNTSDGTAFANGRASVADDIRAAVQGYYELHEEES